MEAQGSIESSVRVSIVLGLRKPLTATKLSLKLEHSLRWIRRVQLFL